MGGASAERAAASGDVARHPRQERARRRSWVWALVMAVASVSCSSRTSEKPSAQEPGGGAASGSATSGGATSASGRGAAAGNEASGGAAAIGGTGPSGGSPSQGQAGEALGGAGGTSDDNLGGQPSVPGGGTGPFTPAPTVPRAWRCPESAWADGVCHCGCGAIDWDCTLWTLDECEQCDAPGSCSGSACPGTIKPSHVVACDIPYNWACSSRSYRDGACDCGCGIVDPDCADESVASCEACDGGCSALPCPGTITEDDNGRCTVAPGWRCYAESYGNGVCDCGCGVPDPDCGSASVDECESCWSGCAHSECPGTIAPQDNTTCDGPPPLWKCQVAAFNDGACHCGCGEVDLDCESADVTSCDVCNSFGSCSSQACPGSISESSSAYCIGG